jgi:hypothetical protein
MGVLESTYKANAFGNAHETLFVQCRSDRNSIMRRITTSQYDYKLNCWKRYILRQRWIAMLKAT